MIADPHSAEKLHNSRYGNPDELNHIKQCFDKVNKLTFKDPEQVILYSFRDSK